MVANARNEHSRGSKIVQQFIGEKVAYSHYSIHRQLKLNTRYIYKRNWYSAMQNSKNFIVSIPNAFRYSLPGVVALGIPSTIA